MRIGVFGGTFDPPHLGHLIVAAEAYEALSLDRLRFIPAATPPHKTGGVHASADLRLRMLRAATAGDPRFEVDDIEVRRGGTSYTVETLRELTRSEPDAELVFLLGVDQFRALSTWRDPDEVARLARLAVVSRSGESSDAGPYPATRVAVSRIDISSTQIRERVAAGKDVRYFVPDAVREIIELEGTYR